MRVLPGEKCECWRWLPCEEKEVEIIRKFLVEKQRVKVGECVE